MAARSPLLSRRQLVRLLVGAGGGALLMACGNQTTPTAGLPAASATVAPRAGVAAATVTRSETPAPSVATPGTPARTRVAPPGASELQRMLALVPRLPDASRGIWFTDVARQKRNYGFSGLSSLAAYNALAADQRERWRSTMASLPLSDVAGVQHVRLDPLPVVGFDFWQLDREIYVGGWPQRWGWMEGSFDQARIAQSLTARGYSTVSYHGQTILTYGADEQMVLQTGPSGVYELQYLNRVVPEEHGLASASTTALTEAGIDAHAGSAATFADSPDYAALALALGGVVAAGLVPGEKYFRRASAGAGTPAPALAQTKLHRYQLVGTALRDDGATPTLLVTLLYEREADARADAPVLHQRLVAYGFSGGSRPLRSLASVGEPAVAAAGGYTALTVPLAITSEASRGFLMSMILQGGDVEFLAEG